MAIETQDIELSGDHVVQFYERESELLRAVVPYLAAAVRAGDVAIVVATEAHRREFDAGLEAEGIDPEQARTDERLLSLDAAATMDRFILAGEIDRTAFYETVGPIIREGARSGRRVRVYGEMVALLWDAGDVLTAIELETLWNELARELPFSLFCAYPAASVSGSEQAEALHQVCHLHSSIHGSFADGDQELLERISDGEMAVEFAPEREAPGRARRLVRSALRRWGYDEVLVDEAALIVTELASNAVLHAGSPFSLAVRVRDSRLRISVEDGAPPAASVPHGGLSPRPMHGLSLIEALCSGWGVDATPDGKMVWAELPCHSPARLD